MCRIPWRWEQWRHRRLQQVSCSRAGMRPGDLSWRKRKRSEGLQLGYLPEWSVGSQEGPAGVEDWDEAMQWVWEVRWKISVGFTRDEVGVRLPWCSATK